MSWLSFKFHSRLLASATLEYSTKCVCVAWQVGRHVSIKLTDSFLFTVFRPRQRVQYRCKLYCIASVLMLKSSSHGVRLIHPCLAPFLLSY